MAADGIVPQLNDAYCPRLDDVRRGCAERVHAACDWDRLGNRLGWAVAIVIATIIMVTGSLLLLEPPPQGSTPTNRSAPKRFHCYDLPNSSGPEPPVCRERALSPHQDGQIYHSSKCNNACADAKPCGALAPNSTNHYRGCHDGQYGRGSSCTMSCDAGFEGRATQFICDETGQWKGTAPVCRRVCGALAPNSTNHYGGCPALTAGSSCTMSCDAGFDGTFTQFICDETGQWKGTAPVCTVRQCKWTLPSDTGMVSNCTKGQSYNFGQKCTVSAACVETSEWTCESDRSWSTTHQSGECPNIRDDIAGGGPILVESFAIDRSGVDLSLSDGSIIHLSAGQRFVSPSARNGWFPDDTQFLRVNSMSSSPAVFAAACNQSVHCALENPPCGIYGCCDDASPQCRCTHNKWKGQTCDRRDWADWPSGWQFICRLLLVLASFVLTTYIGMTRLGSAQSWDDAESPIHATDMSKSRLHRLLSLFVLVEYMQIGGTAFRQTVPWTTVDLSNLMSLRSLMAWVHVAFRVVLFEFEPGFLIQFWVMLAVLCSVSALGVRKWIRKQDGVWREYIARRAMQVAILSQLVGISALAQGTTFRVQDLLVLIPFGAISLVAVGISMVFRVITSNDEPSVFDLFVQFVLPEVLIPVVRRLFAPVVGCVYFHEDEYSPCGTNACLVRLNTMSCSFDDWHYTLMFTAGTILLTPAWAGILHAMITYQADMANTERKPRWPMLPWFVLLHGQIKVSVAISTDSLRDHPHWMLAVLLVATSLELVVVCTFSPHQHDLLNRYRTHGSAFAVWSCLCAYVALAIDDRTDKTSIALLCVGYGLYHLVYLSRTWDGWAAVGTAVGRGVAVVTLFGSLITLGTVVWLDADVDNRESNHAGWSVALSIVGMLASCGFCAIDCLGWPRSERRGSENHAACK